MRILIVSTFEDPRDAQWVRAVHEAGLDVHVLPVGVTGGDADVGDVPRHGTWWGRVESLCSRLVGNWKPPPHVPGMMRLTSLGATLRQRYVGRTRRLARLTARLRPDVIHALDVTSSGRIVVDSSRAAGHDGAVMVSDPTAEAARLGALSTHAQPLREVLSGADALLCAGAADCQAAVGLGFKGVPLPCLPHCGGYDMDCVRAARVTEPVSARRAVMIVGSRDADDRVLFALRGVERAAAEMRGYCLSVVPTTVELEPALQRLWRRTAIPIDVAGNLSWDEYLCFLGQARVVINLNAGGPGGQTRLDAAVMGAFPIQAREIGSGVRVADGGSGLNVDPEDPRDIAAALTRALRDDERVDVASVRGAERAASELARGQVRPQIVKAYRVAREASVRD